MLVRFDHADLKFSNAIFSYGRSFQAKRTAIWNVVTSRSNFPILLAKVIWKRESNLLKLKQKVQLLNRLYILLVDFSVKVTIVQIENCLDIWILGSKLWSKSNLKFLKYLKKTEYWRRKGGFTFSPEGKDYLLIDSPRRFSQELPLRMSRLKWSLLLFCQPSIFDISCNCIKL